MISIISRIFKLAKSFIWKTRHIDSTYIDVGSTVFNMDLDDMIIMSNKIYIEYNKLMDLIFSKDLNLVTPFIKDVIMDIHNTSNVLRLAYLSKGKDNTVKGDECLIHIMDQIETLYKEPSLLKHKTSVDFSLYNFNNAIKSIETRIKHI